MNMGLALNTVPDLESVIVHISRLLQEDCKTVSFVPSWENVSVSVRSLNVKVSALALGAAPKPAMSKATITVMLRWEKRVEGLLCR